MNGEEKDDQSICNDDGLLRRIPNWPNMVKFDKNKRIMRPSSACFSDRKTNDREVSITLEKDLLAFGCTHQDAINNNIDFGLAKVLAKVVRHEIDPSQIINKQATQDDDFHGLIIGNKTKKTKSALAKKAELLITPKIKPTP